MGSENLLPKLPLQQKRLTSWVLVLADTELVLLLTSHHFVDADGATHLD